MLRRVAVALLCLCPLLAATPAPRATVTPRNDYQNAPFTALLDAGLRAFYQRDFTAAYADFESALAVVPDNTLALSFLNATAAQTPGLLDRLVDQEEAALVKSPKSALTHVRLAFSYMFASLTGRDRNVDAREELNAAEQIDPQAQAVHTGFGILREADRSANRAKSEFLAALETDPQNVLAREYLARIYQVDLKDPQRALTTIIDVPNLVPDYADIYFHIASLMHDLGQYPAAVDYATRGIAADVGRVGESGQHGYTLLARIYLDENKPDDARRVLRASISAGADTIYAGALLRRIDDGRYGKVAPPPLPRTAPTTSARPPAPSPTPSATPAPKKKQ